MTTFSNSAKLSVSLDYVNRMTKATLVSPINYPEVTGKWFRMHDENGAIIQQFALVSGSQPYLFETVMTGAGQFGRTFSDAKGGIYSATDNTSIYIADSYTNWHLSSDPLISLYPGVKAYTEDLENDRLTSASLSIPRNNNHYINTPLVVTDGDSVVYGTINSVTGDVFFSVQNDKALGSYSSQAMRTAVVQVLSGAHSGMTFSVRSHNATSHFQADVDLTALSGELVKVMPYRTVTSYSGWSNYTGSNSTNAGHGGIVGKFMLDSTVPTQVGSLIYPSGSFTYVGTEEYNHPLDPTGPAYYGTSIAAYESDIYGRDISEGDLFIYTSSEGLSTGLIVGVEEHDIEIEGDLRVRYWPSGQPPLASSTYTIYRSNKIWLQSFPKLDREYLCTASDYFAINNGNSYSTEVKTPGVVVEFAANDFQSTFPTISETAHFHLGPVHLSNGQMLSESTVGSNNILPCIVFSGTVINGDPESPSTLINKVAMSTQSPNAAHKFNGMYFLNGVLTVPAIYTLNASETLQAKAKIKYGSIEIDRVISVPVQPSV